jgi:hypothetical protein
MALVLWALGALASAALAVVAYRWRVLFAFTVFILALGFTVGCAAITAGGGSMHLRLTPQLWVFVVAAPVLAVAQLVMPPISDEEAHEYEERRRAAIRPLLNDYPPRRKGAKHPFKFRWKPGQPCWHAHPCPSRTYPNHHDHGCMCSGGTALHPCGTCDVCYAIVCKDCKGTLL